MPQWVQKNFEVKFERWNFCPAYKIRHVKLKIENFMWLIEDNYPPRTIDPLDPSSNPGHRGYPPFNTSTQNQWKKSTPAHIEILTRFTYMLKNSIENNMVKIWNLRRRFVWPIWPSKAKKYLEYLASFIKEILWNCKFTEIFTQLWPYLLGAGSIIFKVHHCHTVLDSDSEIPKLLFHF